MNLYALSDKKCLLNFFWDIIYMGLIAKFIFKYSLLRWNLLRTDSDEFQDDESMTKEIRQFPPVFLEKKIGN